MEKEKIEIKFDSNGIPMIRLNFEQKIKDYLEIINDYLGIPMIKINFDYKDPSKTFKDIKESRKSSLEKSIEQMDDWFNSVLNWDEFIEFINNDKTTLLDEILDSFYCAKKSLFKKIRKFIFGGKEK